MQPLLVNSRDINGKFLFGHWMMRPKDGALPFIGPGYGRANYWMTDLDAVEEDMKQMKKLGLKGYVIQLTGLMQFGDGCWDCCEGEGTGIIELPPNGESNPETPGATDPETGEVLPPDPGPPGGWPAFEVNVNDTNYFDRKGRNVWYKEVEEKYKKLIKLCRKYHMWLLCCIMNDFNWQDPNSRLLGWLEQYPTASPIPGSTDHPDRPELSRKRELYNAIRESSMFIEPTQEEVEKLITIVKKAGGASHICPCPVNTIIKFDELSGNGTTFEKKALGKLKGKFRTSVYSEKGKKRGAYTFQCGHHSSVAEATCEHGGIALTSREGLLVELYLGSQEGEEEPKTWQDIGKNTPAIANDVTTVIKAYKDAHAKAALLYAVKYNSDEVDEEALKAIKKGWHGG